MSQQNNTTCSICGKPYYICVSCKSHALHPWRIHTDTAEHYKIYQILHGFTVGLYTKDEARERLNNVDLSDLNEFRDNIKENINKIMTVEKEIKVSADKSDDKEETKVSADKDQNTKSNKKKSVKKAKGMNSVIVNEEV